MNGIVKTGPGKRFMEVPVQKSQPVQVCLDTSLIVEVVNLARAAERLDPIPSNAKLSIMLPHGGDLSGTRYEFDMDVELQIRWEKET
jgi:hypothetical protein